MWYSSSSARFVKRSQRNPPSNLSVRSFDVQFLDMAGLDFVSSCTKYSGKFPVQNTTLHSPPELSNFPPYIETIELLSEHTSTTSLLKENPHIGSLAISLLVVISVSERP